MNAALTGFKKQLQAKLEGDYPATLTISGTNYKGAVVTNEGQRMTMEGGTKQVRGATFSVLKDRLPVAVVRDTTQSNVPVKRVAVTHVETGLVYRLTGEWSDPHGVVRVLTCEGEGG